MAGNTKCYEVWTEGTVIKTKVIEHSPKAADSVVAACKLLSEGKHAKIQFSDLNMVKLRMVERAAQNAAKVLANSPVPGWLLDEQGNVRPEKGE